MGSCMARLPQNQMLALENETYFNRTELKHWYRDFLRDCPAGQLSAVEFQNIYTQFFPSGDVHKFSEYVFQVFDEDKDGFISFPEFIKALSVTSRGSLDEKLDWAFSLYDVNGDGYISRDEMVEILDAIYAMVGPEELVNSTGKQITSLQRADTIFSLMDKDGDGRLTRDEFKEGSKHDPMIVQALCLNAQ